MRMVFRPKKQCGCISDWQAANMKTIQRQKRAPLLVVRMVFLLLVWFVPLVEAGQDQQMRRQMNPTPAPTKPPTRNMPRQNQKKEPTKKPTRKPSRKPTMAPTPKPRQKKPTRKPTMAPTPKPRQQPPPTKKPTRAPTPRPTRRPTPKPTPQPGEQPLFLQLEINPPTSEPSYSPSDLPSSTPTEVTFDEQSSLPIQKLRASNVSMTLGGVLLPLGDYSQVSYQEVTSDYIRRSVIAVLGRETIENLRIKVSLVDNSIPMDRRLQEQNETLVFDAIFVIQSYIADARRHNANRYIQGAFNDKWEQTAYLQDLKETNRTEFANISSVSVGSVNNIEIEEENEASRNTAAIAIPILVVMVLIMLVGYVLYSRRRIIKLSLTTRKRKDKSSKKGNSDNAAVNTTMDLSHASEGVGGDHSVASDLIFDCRMDMSTLGDPDGGYSLAESSLDGMSRLSVGASIDYSFDNIYRYQGGDNDSLVLRDFSKTSPIKEEDSIFTPPISTFTPTATNTSKRAAEESSPNDGSIVRTLSNQSNRTELFEDDGKTVEGYES